MPATALLAALKRPPQPLLLAASLGGWAALGTSAGGLATSKLLCGPFVRAGAWVDVELVFVLFRAKLPIVPWLIMLLAMMPPLLDIPLTHVWVRSFARRRWRSIALFLCAYTATWTVAGMGLMLLALGLRAGLRLEVGAASGLALIVAGLWRATPAWRHCLNRCHGVPRLDAFGLRADRDCVAYGISAALWCIGTCWALMLVPLIAGHAHVLLMMLVTAVAFVERQAPPQPFRSIVDRAGLRSRMVRRCVDVSNCEATPTPCP